MRNIGKPFSTCFVIMLRLIVTLNETKNFIIFVTLNNSYDGNRIIFTGETSF
jgi:hypothetical protein